MDYVGADENRQAWNEIVNRACSAERDREKLTAQVLHDHEEGHTGNIRWCNAEACKTVAAWLGR